MNQKESDENPSVGATLLGIVLVIWGTVAVGSKLKNWSEARAENKLIRQGQRIREEEETRESARRKKEARERAEYWANRDDDDYYDMNDD